MIPARRLYVLMLAGGAIAAFMALFLTMPARLVVVGSLLLIYDGVFLFLAWLDTWRAKQQRVNISRLPIERLSIHRDNLITLTIQAQQSAHVTIADHYPNGFAASPPHIAVAVSEQQLQTATYTVHPTCRGDYQWGDIAMRQLGPWRLAWHSWTIPHVQTVSVYPDLVGLRALTIRLTNESAGSIRRARQRGIGTEFSELKDYGTGDDPRLIDWKATARRDRPLVRVLEPEQEQTLIILLDRGRLMTAQVQGIKRFDWGVNAALSLALAGISRGDRVGIGVFDRQIHTWIPPERGQPHFSKLIERLAPIQPVLFEPDYIGAATTLGHYQTRRALVVFITDIIDKTASAELISAMTYLTPRYLPFCVALRDPEIDQQAHTQTYDVDRTYARAVALDLISQRHRAHAALKQKGVLVLDAPANQISEQLVDRYLELKSQNRL
ncbi:MAG: DUF58 domain-containing protein [Cyanobacteria bacterium P01_E01_bin.6]